MTWARIQAELDRCTECWRLGKDLIAEGETSLSRPPEPIDKSLLFISEAPPPRGGFWSVASDDNLRDSLCRLLNDACVALPKTGARDWLDEFVRQGLFLVQAVKWPLRESARGLRHHERLLIEHSASDHLLPELRVIRPRSIVPLGKVACYAFAQMIRDPGFNFGARTKLEAVRGRHFRVEFEGDTLEVYPAGLPVGAGARTDWDRIRAEIGAALWRHRDPQLSEIVHRLATAYDPERIYLFGSRARGETQPDSDYDLLVVVPDSASRELQRSRLAYRALRGTGVAADVLVYSRGYFESRREVAASLPATVIREGRSLYAA